MSDSDDWDDPHEQPSGSGRELVRQPPPARDAGGGGTLDEVILRQLENQQSLDMPLQQAQAPVLLRLLLTMFIDSRPAPDIEQHGRGVVGEEIDRQSAVMDIRMQQSMIRRAKFRSLT
jgi:hypothetical protein